MADATKSPIVAGDFPDFNPSADVCTKMEQLFASVGKLQTWFAWAFDSTGAWNSAAIQQIVLAATPIGTILPWAASLLSSDKWLICNGAVILRSAYPELFTAIGTLFGAGDGVATFKIPDLSSRFPIGVGTDPLAASGGERTVKLVTAELPAHSHTVPMFQLPATDTNPGGQTLYGPAQGGFVAADITSNDAGSDNPHNNLPPYLAVYFIIRAKP